MAGGFCSWFAWDKWGLDLEVDGVGEMGLVPVMMAVLPSREGMDSGVILKEVMADYGWFTRGSRDFGRRGFGDFW